jgi:hypothetical protein
MIDRTLPFPPDHVQRELMELAIEKGAVLASKGTDNFIIMTDLVDCGFMFSSYYKAAKSYQFNLTSEGLRVLQ